MDAELIWNEEFLAATLKQPAVHEHGNGHWHNYHALCLQHYCHYFLHWTNSKSQTSHVVAQFVPWHLSRKHWATHVSGREVKNWKHTSVLAFSIFYLPPSRCSPLSPMFACLSRRAWMAPTGFALCRAEECSFQLDGKYFGKRLLLKRQIWKLFFCPLSTCEEQVVNTKSLVLTSARLITEYLWKAGTQVLNSNFKRAWISPACCKQIFMDVFELRLGGNLCAGDHNRYLDISWNFERLHSEWDGKIS